MFLTKKKKHVQKLPLSVQVHYGATRLPAVTHSDKYFWFVFFVSKTKWVFSSGPAMREWTDTTKGSYFAKQSKELPEHD